MSANKVTLTVVAALFGLAVGTIGWIIGSRSRLTTDALAIGEDADASEMAPDIIRARSFIGQVFSLMDEDGQLRGFWGIIDGDPKMFLYGRDGSTRVGLQLAEDGQAVLQLWSPGPLGSPEKSGVILAVMEDGSAQISLLGSNEHVSAMLGITEDGRPILVLFDDAGEIIWRQP